MSNLNEEEKQAIEKLKEYALCKIDENGKIEKTGNAYKIVVLNLIEKQQKEYDMLLTGYTKLVNKFEKQEKEIEELKKDKYLLNAETGEITKVGNNCVSKDKIRELLKYLDDEGTRDFWTEEVEEMLNKLLGEN